MGDEARCTAGQQDEPTDCERHPKHYWCWVHRTQPPPPPVRRTDLRCTECGEYFDTLAQQVFHRCPMENE